MELGSENVNPQIKEGVARELKSLSESGKNIEIVEVNRILGKVGTSIDYYCICQSCANTEETKDQQVHYMGKGVAPINSNKIPLKIMESVATNSAFCPDHKVRFDLLGTVSHENGVEPVNIAWYVLPEGTKIDLKKANASNKHWKIYDYQYVNTVNGETITKNLQVVFFLDKKQYERQSSRDEVVKSQIEGTLPTKDIQTLTTKDKTRKRELLPTGKLEMKSLKVRITYEGQDYEFTNRVALLNSLLGLTDQNGYCINPDDPTEISFDGPEYIAQSNMNDKQLRIVADNKDEAIRTIIGIDKRISPNSSSRLEEIVEKAKDDPEFRKTAGELLKKELIDSKK